MVATAPLTRPLTYDDLAALPDDGKRYELINGELIELTGPNQEHQWASGRLFKKFDDFVVDRDLGIVYDAPIDVKFAEHITVQPDLVYVSRERRSILRDLRKIEGVPDLILEILSPSNRDYDLVTKTAIYATFGVPETWIADPDNKTIIVRTWRNGVYVPINAGDDMARSIVLRGLEVQPRDIFTMPTWIWDNDED